MSDPVTATIDSRGRRCPLPVIDLARAAAEHVAGDVLDVLADDPAAATDVPAWCQMRGHEYLGEHPVDAPGPGTAADEGAADGPTATAYRVRLTSPTR